MRELKLKPDLSDTNANANNGYSRPPSGPPETQERMLETLCGPSLFSFKNMKN